MYRDVVTFLYHEVSNNPNSTGFLGDENEINLNTKHAEFIDWKWIEPKLLPEVIVDFKKKLYLNLLKEINLVID